MAALLASKALATMSQEDIVGSLWVEAAKAANSVFEACFMDIGICFLEQVQSQGLELESLSDMLCAAPSLNSCRKNIKHIMQAFGNSKTNLMCFLSHRTVYMLGALQSMRDELGSFALRQADLEADPSLLSLLNSAQETCAVGLASLRQMVAQTASMDVEFAEQHSWAQAAEDKRHAVVQEWAAELASVLLGQLVFWLALCGTWLGS